ncbi:hypothetical protein M422DRAFT_248880 [Sphaerobolus stellatus SS14]|nr:hypothetical protein M422DRAFT_248880 [Sphaerobolus stellatus SS14]
MSTTSSMLNKRARSSNWDTTPPHPPAKAKTRPSHHRPPTCLLHKHDEGYEEAIKAGICNRYVIKLSYWQLEKKYRVSWSTLKRRFKGGKDRVYGHQAQAHLLEEAKQVLVEYCKYQALLAQPLNSLALWHHLYVLSGRKPSEEWGCQFLKKHPEIKMHNARGLDPKCATTGAACPPTFVLPKGAVKEWSHVEGVGGVVTSENGWMDDSIGSQQFKKVFIPWAKAQSDPTFPLVFISHGHSYHETHEICLAALNHNITMISLPPHTTHKLQPLDVGVFVPLQCMWGKRCNELAVTGVEVTHDTVVEEYVTVRKNSMMEKTIVSAWCHSGLYPYNRDVFTNVDYTPAIFFSSQVSKPKTFVEYIASSAEEAVATKTENTSDGDYIVNLEEQPESKMFDEPDMDTITTNVDQSSSHPRPPPPPSITSNVSATASFTSTPSEHSKRSRCSEHLVNLSQPPSRLLLLLHDHALRTQQMPSDHRQSQSLLHFLIQLPSDITNANDLIQRKDRMAAEEVEAIKQERDTAMQWAQQLAHDNEGAHETEQQAEREARLEECKEWYFLESNLCATESQITLESLQNVKLHKDLESRKKKKHKLVNALGRLMTSPKMEVTLRTQITVAQACELEETATKHAKAAATLRTQEKHILNKATCIFIGPVKAMKKSDLQALAYALDLVIEGTKEGLASRILQQFEANIDLKKDVYFKGIFKKKKQGWKTKGVKGRKRRLEKTLMKRLKWWEAQEEKQEGMQMVLPAMSLNCL